MLIAAAKQRVVVLCRRLSSEKCRMKHAQEEVAVPPFTEQLHICYLAGGVACEPDVPLSFAT